MAGKQFRKLVAKDGQPLRPDEARKEEGRVAKAVREHRERHSRQEAAQSSPGPAMRGDDDVTPSDVLRLCRLVNPRREEFRGQPAIAYDFEPRPGAKPRGRAESWIARDGRPCLGRRAGQAAPAPGGSRSRGP